MDKKTSNNKVILGIIVFICVVCVVSLFIGHYWGTTEVIKEIPRICTGEGYVSKDFTNGVINLTNDLIDYINKEHNATVLQHMIIIK